VERVYTVTVSGVASPAAAFDMLEVLAATNKGVQLTRMHIGQTSEPTTEEEQLAVQVIRGYTTTGSGGSTATPVPLDSNDSAMGATVKTMNTTIASAGSPLTQFDTAMNIRAGLDVPFAPDEAPVILGGERMVVRIGAPTDAVTFRATFWIKEMR
jgi:hypothetical protein